MGDFTIPEAQRLLELQAKPAKKMSVAERREYNAAPDGAVALAREVITLRRSLAARDEAKAAALRARSVARTAYDEAVDALVWSTEGGRAP